MDIKNNTIIVTGGASGLGAATAEMLVAQGGRVVIADMNLEAGEALATKLGTAARFIECDVTKEEHAQATIALAQSDFGGLQGLINSPVSISNGTRKPSGAFGSGSYVAAIQRFIKQCPSEDDTFSRDQVAFKKRLILPSSIPCLTRDRKSVV